MDIRYKLKRDCVSRIATMLAWDLKNIETNSGIRITYNGTVFNGKSLLGILNAHMMYGEEFTITIDDEKIVNEVKEILSEIADEV